MSSIRLTSLSREVIVELFGLLTIADVCQMYCTGDRALKDLIESCPTGRLKFESRIQINYGRLPKIATSSRGLKHFTISTESHLVDFPYDTLRSIKLLPVGLVTLKLSTPEAERMLEETNADELEALYKLYRTSFPNDDANRRPRMFNMAQQFPTLEKLVVKGPISEKGFFEAFELFVLPPQLRSLSWQHSSKLNDDIFNYLPSSLVALGLGPGVKLLDFDASAKPLFPPHLETLKWHRVSTRVRGNVEEKWDMIAALPPSLTVFKYVSATQIPNDLVKILPPKLTILGSRSWDLETAVYAFPKGLTSLDLQLPPQGLSLLKLVLPVHLTALSFSTLGALSNIDWTALPRSLLKLRVLATGHFSNGEAPSLPPNLSEVSFGNLAPDTQGPSLEGRWPAGLIHLLVDGGPSNYKGLPLTLSPSITYLCLSELLLEDMKYLPVNLRALTCFKKLPSNFACLPPRLTTLYAVQIDSLSTEMINQLPRTLTSLRISHNEITTLKLKDVANWPPSLTMLRLDGYRLPLTIEDLNNLPRGIRCLKVESEISGDLFGELPGTLQIFRCGNVSERFGENLVNLPMLTDFESSRGSFDSALLFHLPPTITRLVLPKSIIRQYHMCLLPLGIIRVNMRFHHHDSEDFSMRRGPYNWTTRKLTNPIPSRPPPTYTRQTASNTTKNTVSKRKTDSQKEICIIS